MLRHKRSIFLLGMVIISLYSGPILTDQAMEEQVSSETLWNITNEFRLIGMKTFENVESGTLNLEISDVDTSINMSFFAHVVSNEEGNKLLQSLDTINKELDDGNITQLAYNSKYMEWITNNSLELGITQINEKWEYVSTESVSILFGVFNWNITESFIERINIKATWVFSRSSSYIVSLITLVMATLWFVIEVSYTYYSNVGKKRIS